MYFLYEDVGFSENEHISRKGKIPLFVWLEWPQSKREKNLKPCLFLVSSLVKEDESQGSWSRARSEMSNLFFPIRLTRSLEEMSVLCVKGKNHVLVIHNYLFADTQVSNNTL